MRSLVLLSVVACSKPASSLSVAGSGSGSGVGSGSSVQVRSRPIDALIAVDSGAVDSAAVGSGAAPPVTATRACLAMTENDDGYQLGEIGSDLVTCGGTPATTCFTIDRKTGALSPRTEVALPGVEQSIDAKTLPSRNCYQGMCWKAAEGQRDWIEVAANPDGKRAAILDAPTLTIFDVTSKKALFTLDADGAGAVWFAADLLLVEWADAGPHAEIQVYGAAHGTQLYRFMDAFEGGVGISTDGTIVVQEDALADLTVIPGRWAKHRTISRKLPKQVPCDASYPYDIDPNDPKDAACKKFSEKYYNAYRGATIVADGDGFIGLRGHELFTLDAKLVETSRIKLTTCAAAPKQPPP